MTFWETRRWYIVSLQLTNNFFLPWEKPQWDCLYSVTGTVLGQVAEMWTMTVTRLIKPRKLKVSSAYPSRLFWKHSWNSWKLVKSLDIAIGYMWERREFCGRPASVRSEGSAVRACGRRVVSLDKKRSSTLIVLSTQRENVIVQKTKNSFS